LHAALRRSSAIIATSPNYLASSPVLAHHREKCVVIPLGIPLQDFDSCDPRRVADVRQQYGGRLIVSVGRLVYYKGFEYLIRAMTRVQGRLLIVGEGPLRGRLNALAADLGVSDRVTFLGRIDHQSLVSCYHAAKVFALASIARSEAFGIVQIEAMAAGLPVVNTQLDSGVPFVSLDGQTGLTVPPANPDSLAAAINRLLDDDALRQSFGRAAAMRARQEFSLESMTSKTLALYDRVVANSEIG
jgi:rhamnosyl/mannosyltransferase